MSHSMAMKPKPGSKFIKREVEAVLAKIISAKVANKPYVYEESLPLAKDLSADIQQAVASMGYERYKLIVQVNIIEAAQQGIRISSRCLWDPEVDNYAEYTHSTPTMHVNALCFGLYWE